MGLQQNDSPLIITILSYAFFQNRWVFSLFFFLFNIFFNSFSYFTFFSCFGDLSITTYQMYCLCWTVAHHSTLQINSLSIWPFRSFSFFLVSPLSPFPLLPPILFSMLPPGLPTPFPRPPFPTCSPFLWFHLCSFTGFTSFFSILSLSLTIIVFLYVQKYT